ncbi:MAG: arsenical efflux pump membrane protein ArsB, partial [Castellaniella sp.]|uniref:arsenical efflux pump membrane protein ArsB n=1 Tax=Castellaniella sp. TaxID=1955812 RepID=UPI003C790C5B
MMLALALFVLTLVLVIWQPRGLGIGWSASLGAGLALLTGVIQPADIPVVWGIVWNATGTFVAVVIISLLLEAAGFFEWAALHMARLGGGRGGRLFVLMILLGAGVSALFNNDGAALILTPIVVAMLAALRFSSKATLAFVMAAGFIADTASLPLVVSNLVNIVTADYFDIGFARYAAIMAPVDLAAILASLAVLGLVFRRAIPPRYDVQRLSVPAAVVRDRPTFLAGWGVLAWLLLGFFVLEPLGIPVSATAAIGALVLAGVAARGGRIPVLRRVRGAPWQIIVFALGMYLVVYGLRNEGLTDYLGQVLAGIAEHGGLATAAGTGFLVAGMS